MKRVVLSLILALGFGIAAGAQEQSMVFTRIPADPALAGTAGASAASSESVNWAAFGNSAAMAFHNGRFGVSADYSQWAHSALGSDRMAIASFISLGPRFKLSLAALYGMGASYEMIDDRGVSTGEFQMSDMMGAVGISLLLAPQLSVGVNARYAMQQLDRSGGPSSVMADAYLMYKLGAVQLSAGAMSLGPGTKDEAGASFGAPASGNLAAWAEFPVSVHSFGVGLDSDVFFNGGVSVSAGAEYSFNKMLFARAGYHFATDKAPIPSYASAGLGVKIAGVTLDAAYFLGSSTVGGSLNLALGCRF